MSVNIVLDRRNPVCILLLELPSKLRSSREFSERSSCTSYTGVAHEERAEHSSGQHALQM